MKKRDYKIVHLQEDNERVIMVNDDGIVRWLAPNKIRTWNKGQAKRYLHREDCISDLVIVKMGGKLEEQELERPEGEVQSWGQLSS